MSKVNYTAEQVTKMVAAYVDAPTQNTIDVLAEELNKTVRSVRQKLVREGVYQKAEKPAPAPKQEGPTKAELLEQFASFEAVPADFPMDALGGATKPAIEALVALMASFEEVDAE